MLNKFVLDADTPNFTADAVGQDVVEQANFVIGSDDANTIEADAQGDRVEANGGDDNVVGGTGVDTVLGGTGEDTLNGGGSDDKLLGDADNDLLLGSFDNNSNGEDTLWGGDGEDVFVGFAGDDTILAGQRNNWNGKLEDGQDVIVIDALAGNDKVWGFSQADDIFFINNGEEGEGFAGIAGLEIEIINGKHTLVTYQTEEGTATVNVRNEVLTEDNFTIDLDDLSQSAQAAIDSVPSL
ncbi:MAG: hypothetical protein AAGJ94_00220 [Pseudomonadota bacterium]